VPIVRLAHIGHGSNAVNAFDRVLGQKLRVIRTNIPSERYYTSFYRYRDIPGKKWSHYRSSAKLVSTGNRRKLHVIIVGTGLSGSSLAAALGEMGYQVTCFCFSRYRPAGPFRGRTGWRQHLQELQK
jgi:hypothetical protein